MQSRARRVVDTARTNVPEGTWAVGAGLFLASLAAWGYQILAERNLSDNQYNAVNALWITTFVVTPGFFQPLEQEVARAIAARRERGVGGGPVLWKAARLGALLVGVVAVFVVVFSAVARGAVDHFFRKVPGEWLLVAALIAALVTYATAYLARGALSGNARFRNYGLMHGTEGTVRIVAVVAIVALFAQPDPNLRPVKSLPVLFAFALVLPPIVAVIVSLWGQRGLAEPGPDAPYSELSNALAWLLASSVFAQLLSYAPVFAAQVLEGNSKEEQKLLAGFITAMFLARVPLLMFQAVQAPLLPKLAAHSESGRHDEFRAGLLRLFAIVFVIAAIGILGALVAGRVVGKLVFHEKWTLGNGELALLAAGAGAYIIAFTLAQGLIALRAYTKLTLGWTAGAVAFVLAMVMPIDSIYTRAELSFLLSSVAAAGFISWFLLKEMDRKSASLADLVGVIEREPLEF